MNDTIRKQNTIFAYLDLCALTHRLFNLLFMYSVGILICMQCLTITLSTVALCDDPTPKQISEPQFPEHAPVAEDGAAD